MHELSNAELRITLLDPREDRARLGPRFCWGGYIWQVEDAAAGPLLSGPEGSIERPDPFNGHGLPEAFRDRTRDGQELTWRGNRGLAPGAGVLERNDQQEVALVEPCTWSINAYRDRFEFHTEHGDGDHRYALTRLIQLVGREVLSTTRFSNLGHTALALQWFAHPFFVLDAAGQIDVQLPPAVTLPPSAGFVLADQRLSLRRRFLGKDDGHFELLSWAAGERFDVTLSHPRLESIRFTASFAPSECPIWANGYTFSIEPYQTVRLDPIETRQWTLRYIFGAPIDVPQRNRSIRTT